MLPFGRFVGVATSAMLWCAAAAIASGCSEPVVELVESSAATCSDGADNDGDGFVDCADIACAVYCPAGGDADGDADADAPPYHGECIAEGTYCEADRVFGCSEEGARPEVLEVCIEPPNRRCIVGLCEPGQTEERPCCAPESPFCRGALQVSGGEPLDIEIWGPPEEAYSCTLGASYFEVESPSMACVQGFVWVRIRVRAANFPSGVPTEICRDGTSLAEIVMGVAEPTDSGSYIPVNYLAADCTRASGEITFTASDDTRSVEVDVVLYSDESGTSRPLHITAFGQ